MPTETHPCPSPRKLALQMCRPGQAWSQAGHQRTPNFQWWYMVREETPSRTVLCLLKRNLVPSPRKLAFKCVTLARLGPKSATNARINFQMTSHFSWKAVGGACSACRPNRIPVPPPESLHPNVSPWPGLIQAGHQRTPYFHWWRLPSTGYY